MGECSSPVGLNRAGAGKTGERSTAASLYLSLALPLSLFSSVLLLDLEAQS